MSYTLARGSLAVIGGTAGSRDVPVKILAVRMMRHQYGETSFPVAICRVTAARAGYVKGETVERDSLITRDNRYAALLPDVLTRCQDCSASWQGGTRAVAGIVHMSNHCRGAVVDGGTLAAIDARALSDHARARGYGSDVFYGDGNHVPVYLPV